VGLASGKKAERAARRLPGGSLLVDNPFREAELTFHLHPFGENGVGKGKIGVGRKRSLRRSLIFCIIICLY
jgi:hypothetical protein